MLLTTNEYLTLKEDLKQISDLRVRDIIEQDLEAFMEYIIKWKGDNEKERSD